jgi:hypothetical protein
MSQPLAAGDIVLAQFVSVAGPQVALTGFHYRVDSTTGASVTDQFAAAAFDTNFNVNWKAILSNDVTYQGITFQKIWPLPVYRRRISYANTGVGTGGVGTLPTQTSGLVKLQTDFSGRAMRGRIFLPFPSKAVSSTGPNPTPLAISYILPAQTIIGSLIATQVLGIAPDTATLKPIIWHRALHTGTDLPSNGYTVEIVWATTRRRGALGRPNTIPL